MKRLPLILILFISAIVFSSCEEAPADNAVNHEAVLTSGEWNILFFFDVNGEQGKTVRNYNYAFKTGGSLNARNNSTNADGIWSIGEVNDEGKKMTIDFSNTGFEDMEHKWIVSSITDDKLELVRFGDSGQVSLVFVKM